MNKYKSKDTPYYLRWNSYTGDTMDQTKERLRKKRKKALAKKNRRSIIEGKI